MDIKKQPLTSFFGGILLLSTLGACQSPLGHLDDSDRVYSYMQNMIRSMMVKILILLIDSYSTHSSLGSVANISPKCCPAPPLREVPRSLHSERGLTVTFGQYTCTSQGQFVATHGKNVCTEHSHIPY